LIEEAEGKRADLRRFASGSAGDIRQARGRKQAAGRRVEEEARQEDARYANATLFSPPASHNESPADVEVPLELVSTEALREAKSTIKLLEAASDEEVSLLRAKLAHLEQVSKKHSAQPAITLPAHYRDLDLGFAVDALPFEDAEDHTLRCEEEMLAAPACSTAPLARHYKDLALGFSVDALSIDF
jgi:hypothetical protein